MPPLLELKGMTKTFPGVKANDNVNLILNAGEVHALLGENGAGKSTLVKMIYGILRPDSGQMYWLGEPSDISNPATARSLGIAMVFQHFSLFDSMSVLENIALGVEKGIDKATLEQQIVDISNRYGLPLEPGRHVYTLSVGECQRIEIIRCLLQNPKLLVMDEPTSVLTPQEVSKLFETLNRLSDEGVAILYISHKLDEIKALCEKATILRAGKVVESVDVAGESPQSLAAKMMGQELPPNPNDAHRKAGDIRLDICNLNQPPQNQFSIRLKDINLQVRSGEIVGIAGVAGNGQDELLKVLNGEQLSTQASAVSIDNQPCANYGSNQRRALGMASIPEQRLGHGAVSTMSLIDNTLLTAFQRLNLLNFGFIGYAQSRKYCSAVVEDFKVKSNGITAEAGSLSGGNLQKFIVGREIKQNPTVLIVSQPTWGVDAGAARTIHNALRELADNGTAILVISQDLDELMAISDRIAAICAGSLSPTTPTSEITIEQIGLMMAGVDNAEAKVN
ncbi:ABC transporter ATP-binding protein [Candidatus Spongiihabitans sp.]|uniref:ABC transporter ATP-binding protein n=1 Tax=Candidatus Spongiihabitans sp. TaxID=3101308 RepID=UPI003C6F88F4